MLNEREEKFHRIEEIFIEPPELIAMIYQAPDRPGPGVPIPYYLPFFCAQIFPMRARRILRDSEWAGWLGWLKNTFRSWTVRSASKETGMDS
ncbi:MAG TPA: hypothetical protein VMH90_00760 [Thermoplasmata archaeon]|nr:hypothetical protein [Thermoplasmata archaeon]